MWFQGQIKTGAPCRSERLAKYNQVSSGATVSWKFPVVTENMRCISKPGYVYVSKSVF